MPSDIEKFQQDLLESVRQMKQGEAAKTTHSLGCTRRSCVPPEAHQRDLNQELNSSAVIPRTQPLSKSSCRARASVTQDLTTASSLSADTPRKLSNSDSATIGRSAGASCKASSKR